MFDVETRKFFAAVGRLLTGLLIATVVGADALALLHIISPILALIAVSAVGGVAALIDHFGH